MKKISISYWVVFILATIALSKFFNAHKFLETGEDIQAFLNISISLLVLIMTLAFMAYKIYSEEKIKNNLKIRIPVFDWIFERRQKK